MEGAPLNQFDFYLRFAKPLVLNLAEPNERVLAAAWLQKLRNPDSGDEQLRTDYLKLLLFVLQRKRLAGPFTQNPGQYEKLEHFPEQYKLQDVAKAVIEAEEEDRRKKAAQGRAGATGDYPPYTTEYSADLLEYTAAQDIPNFGVHVYYAISKDPLPLWDKADKGIFPRTLSAGKIDLTRSPSAAASTSTLSGFGARARSKSRSRSRSRSRTGSPRKRPSRGKTPPAPPLGVPPPPDERLPPTWGTNLIQVSEPPKFQEAERVFLEESFPDYEEPFSGDLSGDLRFKGPSPQDYASPFDISAYEPRPYALRAIRRLDFDEDITKIQHRPGMPFKIPRETAEDIARITAMLGRDSQKAFVTPATRGIVTAAVAPPAPKKITKKTSLTKRIVKPGKPAPKAKVVAKPPPPPKKKISKTTVKKTTTRGGKKTIEETVTTVEEPSKSEKQRTQQQKGKVSPLKPEVPTRRQEAEPSPEEFQDYDMDELKKLGLTEADLADIDIDNLSGEIYVEDISDQEVQEYEEIPGIDVYDKEIMKKLDEYDRRIKELEVEHADDIAMAEATPGFLEGSYDNTQYATDKLTSEEEIPHYGPLPTILQVSDPAEDTAKEQLARANEIEDQQEDIDYIQEWLDRFEREQEEEEKAAAAATVVSTSARPQTPRRAPVVPTQPIKTPEFPPMTPSKGAIKKVITKKTSKSKGGIKSVVESTTTISQPVAPDTSSKLPLAGTGTKIPLSRSAISAAGTRISVPPGSNLPILPSRIARPAGSKLPQPEKTIKKTTMTTTRVVEPQPPLPDIADLSAASLPYRTPPLPYPVYEIDEELDEYRLLEAEVLRELSKSERQLEQLKSEETREKWLQSKSFGNKMEQGQSRNALEAVLDQMDSLYSVERVSTTRSLPGQVYETIEIDEELAEYKAMEENILAGLSESQKQFERLEAEQRRMEIMQTEASSTDMTSIQSRTTFQAVLDQMESLYKGSRMPLRESWPGLPLSEAPSLPYRTPPLPTKTPSEVAVTKTTTRKVIKTEGGLTTVKESKTIEKPKGPATGSKKGITKRAIPTMRQPAQGVKKSKLEIKPTSGKLSSVVSEKPGVKKIKPDTRPKKILPGTPAAQAIIDEANQQMYKLDQLYKKYQLPERRPDVERTPPVFSEYGDIRETGAGIVYPAEQFGLTEQEAFQPGMEYFKDRKDFSPYVDHRRPIAEVFPGLKTFPEPSDWLLAEEQLDEEVLETVVTPTRPSPKQEIEEIMRDIEVSPTWAGLPVTTPKRSPSPRRTTPASASPVMLQSPEDGLAVLQERKEIPPYALQLKAVKPGGSPPSLLKPKRKQPLTEQTYTTTTTTTTTTQKTPSVGDGKLVTVVEESTTTSKVNEAEVVRPSSPPVARSDEIQEEGFADVYPDVYKSPPHLQRTLPKRTSPKRISPKRTSPMSAQEAASLEDMEQNLITSPLEPVSPHLRDGEALVDYYEMDMDMYELSTSPEEDNKLRSEQIEVIETRIVEETDTDATTEQRERTPYVMIGKTRGKVYPVNKKLVKKPDRSPIQEEMEVEEEAEVIDEPFIYVTTMEETKVVQQTKPDVTETSPERFPSYHVKSPPQLEAVTTYVQIEDEINPDAYYDSPRKPTPPPPKPPLPVLDPFLVDVAYAEHPEMRRMRPVKRKPRVSPVKEDLEIEPESPTAPRIQTTPRRARTPSPPLVSSSGTLIKKTRSRRALKRRLIDFSQTEPGTEGQRPPHILNAELLDGFPLPGTSATFYPDDLAYQEMPLPSDQWDAQFQIPLLPEPMQPQMVKERPKTSNWGLPHVDKPRRLDIQKIQFKFSPSSEPVLNQEEYVSIGTMEVPYDIYSPNVQYGDTVSMDKESPRFLVKEEITKETIEEVPPAPPTRWPTPPPERPPDELTRKAKEVQQISKQQYESLWTPSPHTPPKQESVWDRQNVEILEAEIAEELAPAGSPLTPFSTIEAMQEMLDTLRGKRYVESRSRRPVALYGYGERKEKVVERKSKPPSLATVPDDRIEPQEDYVYWPGPYNPVSFTPLKKVLSPKRLHPGHARSPLYANLPPESAKRRNMIPPPDQILELPAYREPTARHKTPPVLIIEEASGETPVSRYAVKDRRGRRLEAEMPAASPPHEVQTRQATTEVEQDPLKNIMDTVSGQLAALYTPPPPPIKTPKGPRGQRMRQVKKRLFADMGEPEAETVPAAEVPHGGTVETVETQELFEMPQEYSTHEMELSPQMDHVPDIVELEYDVEPGDVYYRRDPQVSPAERPKIKAPTLPPQTSPEISPRVEYGVANEGGIYDDDEDFGELSGSSEELPSPFLSYTPAQSPPGVDPRLKEELMMHEYTSGLERDERPYQRPFVRVGSRSQYYMGNRLPPQELDIVEEEGEIWPEWEVQEAPVPVAKPRLLQPKPQTPRAASPVRRPRTPSPRIPTPPPRIPTPPPRIPTPPPQPSNAVFARQRRSPTMEVPVTYEDMQKFEPPPLYTEEDKEDVAELDPEFVQVEAEGSVASIMSDTAELAPEPEYYYESPTTQRMPSPFLSYTPPLSQPSDKRQRSPPQQTIYSEGRVPEEQRKSPIWTQFAADATPGRISAEQMMVAPSRSEQEAKQVRGRRRLQFETTKPPKTPPMPPAPQPKIGRWITPPPSSSRDTPPILQKRPEFVSPPSAALLASLLTPPSQRRVSPRAPTTRFSPLPPPTKPWLPAPTVPSIEIDVAESATSLGVSESDYEGRAPFGGSRSPGIHDTSPIRLDIERSFIEDELKGFKWMDQ